MLGVDSPVAEQDLCQGIRVNKFFDLGDQVENIAEDIQLDVVETAQLVVGEVFRELEAEHQLLQLDEAFLGDELHFFLGRTLNSACYIQLCVQDLDY